MEEKIVYRIRFSKGGLMRFISHLDLMRLFARAERRAGFALYLSKGFSPHPIVRIRHALKLGVAARSQEAELLLKETLDKDEFKKRLASQLPDGIRIEDVEVIG